MPKIKLNLKGRPGWHIECSAMSMKHLTEVFDDSKIAPEKFKTIDIHSGGVDLVFPHHEDEIAQSEGCTDKQFVKYWMHSEHLLVDGKKMSKSLGNFYTLKDLLEKGYNPIAIRYLLLSTHYRQKLNFTFESLEGATTVVQRINDFVLRLKEVEGAANNPKVNEFVKKAKHQFETSLDDDLEISPALAAIFDLMNEINKLIEAKQISKADAEYVIQFMEQVDTVLGILTDGKELTPEQQELLKKRIEARENKQWDESDRIRDELNKQGIAVEDTPQGQRWKRIIA